MKPEIARQMAKRLAEDLHHEARLERIIDIIEHHQNLVWVDGFADGFEQGRTLLESQDEVQEIFHREWDKSIEDATGTP